MDGFEVTGREREEPARHTEAVDHRRDGYMRSVSSSMCSSTET